MSKIWKFDVFFLKKNAMEIYGMECHENLQIMGKF